MVAVVEVEAAKDYDKVDPETGVSTRVAGKPQNRIKKYLPLGSAPSAPAATPAAKASAAATEAPAKGKTPPWKK